MRCLRGAFGIICEIIGAYPGGSISLEVLFMATKVAINGLGRIGRTVLRCWVARRFKDVEIVALNNLIPPEDMAYYVKYDSTHGKAPFEVKADSESLILDGIRIPMFVEKDPVALPWKKLGVDIVSLNDADLVDMHAAFGFVVSNGRKSGEPGCSHPAAGVDRKSTV